MKIREDNNIFIVDCKRTAIAGPNRGLKHFTAAQLAAFVIDDIFRKNKFDKTAISEVILGNTVSAGTGQNLARQAVSLSELAKMIPAYVVNNVCGSGLQAVILGVQKIIVENANFVIAGASESATHNPKLVFKNKEGMTDSLLNDGLICSLAEKQMGEICEDLARKEGISREEQDQYALESHNRACLARATGKFEKEIVPIPIEGAAPFSLDERPRRNASLDKLKRLPSVFIEGGTITAGNSSAPCDGACAFLLASQEAVEVYQLPHLAKIVGYAAVAVDPTKVFSEGTIAIRKCLHDCGLGIGDIDLFEITEAFAAQAVYTWLSMKLLKKQMNIFGGDIALGHPLGMAGARALVTLVHALIDQKKKRGLAYVAFGAGGAIAMIVEITCQ